MAGAIANHARDEDLAAWADKTARSIEAGALDFINWTEVVEQLRELSSSQQHEVRLLLRTLLANLLEYSARVNEALTILTQRDAILDLFDESPSFGNISYRTDGGRGV